jgi:hypothetical protein
VLSPKRGARVGRKRTTLVRWRATDADGDELSAKLDYSADDGHNWRPIYAGPNSGSARVPSEYFSGSRRARVRVRVSDGFNEGLARSGRFTAVGRRPQVVITSPVAGQRVVNHTALYLAGKAVDDAHRPLRGRRLQWFLGRKRLGRGSSISVLGLPPGRRTIRLVARDRRGRKASARVRVRVIGAAPQFLDVRAPRKLSPRARRLRLRVAATIPARLRIGRQRYRVGRRLKKLTVRVKRGRSPLVLKLRLSSGRKGTVRKLLVPRG